MTKTRGAAHLLRLLIPALLLCHLFVVSQAHAYGRVEWKTKSMKESDSHSWTIEVSIYLDRAPDVATLPMRFSFTPYTYYERALLDGKDGPQLRKVPLEGKPPLVESVDVGFMDPGSGQIQKRTKFSFKVNRGHGFEAGEYEVTIKDGRTDATIGQKVKLEFDGENEVIDRRAMVFSGEKKKKASDEGDEKKDAPPPKKELTPDDPGYWEGGPKNPEKNEEVEPKRGCGCRVGAAPRGLDHAAFALAAAALVASRARRRPRHTEL